MKFSYVFITCFLLCSCTRKPPLSAPAVGWKHAVDLLEHDGWKVTGRPAADEDSLGCVSATKSGDKGRVCFVDCDGRSVDEIKLAVGSRFAYQIGDLDTCATYTEFDGSSVFRNVVATEAYSQNKIEKSIPAICLPMQSYFGDEKASSWLYLCKQKDGTRKIIFKALSVKKELIKIDPLDVVEIATSDLALPIVRTSVVYYKSSERQELPVSELVVVCNADKTQCDFSPPRCIVGTSKDAQKFEVKQASLDKAIVAAAHGSAAALSWLDQYSRENSVSSSVERSELAEDASIQADIIRGSGCVH